MKTKRQTYDRAWQRASGQYLANHPVCQTPGCRRPAIAVDHIVPVKLAPYRRLDRTNFQALCQPCHNRITAAFETGNMRGACDLSGGPLDPHHPWAQPDNASATKAANAKPGRVPYSHAARFKAERVRGEG